MNEFKGLASGVQSLLYQLVQEGVLTEDEFAEYKKKALRV
jgi:hypothetical protein